MNIKPIIHTDFMSENELYHWEKKNHKYIRKYKNSKGKWVYVYADQATHDRLLNKQNSINYQSDNINNLEKQADYWSKEGSKYGSENANNTSAGYKRAATVARETLNKDIEGYYKALDYEVSNTNANIQKGAEFLDNFINIKSNEKLK